MALDKEMEEAIRAVVTDAGQPQEVASGLIAWMRELSEAELSQADQRGHLEAVRDAITVKANNAN